MEIKDILFKVDRMILYSENKDLILEISKIDDESYFRQIMDGLSEDKKKNIEQIMLYLLFKDKNNGLGDWEKKIADNYNRYLDKCLDNDYRIYYNNEYCLELLNLAFGDEKVDTFMGRNLGKLDNYLVKKYNEMMELVYNKQVLSQEDQDFLVNNFLYYASDIGIYKDEMPDIVAFAEQYPIKDFNNFKNRCLYILYLLSLELMNIKKDAIIKFDDASNGNILGSCYHNDTKVKVVIYNMNIYYLKNIKEFLDKLFTFYHELCHVYQEDNSNKYDDETLQRFYIENEVIKNNYDFYIRPVR